MLAYLTKIFLPLTIYYAKDDNIYFENAASQYHDYVILFTQSFEKRTQTVAQFLKYSSQEN